jgi:hypothetical protein
MRATVLSVLVVNRDGYRQLNCVLIVLISLIKFGLFFVERGRDECTSETGRGQFSIFGAVEDNAGHSFRESERIKKVC